jgi:hypothetical protein
MLDKIGITYAVEDTGLLMEWETKQFDELKVLIWLSPDSNWLFIAALFSEIDEIPEEQQPKLMRDMLEASWRVNGVKFVITDDGYLQVSAETNVANLRNDDLDNLISNVVGACDVFAEFAPGYSDDEDSKRERTEWRRQPEVAREKITERIVETRVLIVCPFCGHKNEQGISKCQKCSADF